MDQGALTDCSSDSDSDVAPFNFERSLRAVIALQKIDSSESLRSIQIIRTVQREIVSPNAISDEIGVRPGSSASDLTGNESNLNATPQNSSSLSPSFINLLYDADDENSSSDEDLDHPRKKICSKK